jgi:nucleoid-associated protein YgaU
MDAGAPPAPGAPDLAPPPGGDLAPPPAAPGAVVPVAPAPAGGDLAPPPADNLFPEGGSDDAKPAKKHHGEGGAKVTHYEVSKHDSLWKISAKKKVYADAWQWPVLFITNRDIIKDPDLIKPGQDLKVARDLGSEKVASAVQKAKDTPRYEPHTTAREKLPIDY